MIRTDGELVSRRNYVDSLEISARQIKISTTAEIQKNLTVFIPFFIYMFASSSLALCVAAVLKY